jgi:single-strand selective monofunctional uracil DNA glycosylase
MRPVKAAEELRDACEALSFSADVPYVYNPLEYAWDPHSKFATRFGKGISRRGIFVGMNPGPWGMGQTGVPFGDITKVRDWMGITGKVEAPPRMHPKRPVQGFTTKRREPSGTRLYGWAEEKYGTADAFFAEFFVLNYCPLLFFTESGANLTPPQLKKSETSLLYAACDRHVAQVVDALKPEFLIGVGGFAEARISEVVEREGLDVKVGSVLHPSPANPKANQGWARQAEAQLQKLGVL